jgi:hypothetical protein
MSARTVALLTSRSAFSLVKANSYDARGEERLVRQEIFNAALAKLIDGRSATLRLRMDCAHSEISLVEARVYAGNSRLGAARVVPPDLWRAQNPDVDLSDFIVLACGGTPAPGADTVRVAASAAATPPLDATQVAGAHWVQIGAFRDSRSAEERWRALRRLMPEETQGLSWRTEIIRAKSLVLHRALVGPFPASLDASAFCVKASRKGYVCIAR